MAAADPRPVARALNAAGARYVVIGGHAVGANGAPRATRDTDLLVAPGAENWTAVLGALVEVGAPREAALSAASPRPHLRVETGFGPVDVLEEGSSPLSFAEVAAGALSVELDGVDVPICGLAELVAFKRLAGRTQDRADLEALEAARGPLPLLSLPGLDAPPG